MAPVVSLLAIVLIAGSAMASTSPAPEGAASDIAASDIAASGGGAPGTSAPGGAAAASASSEAPPLSLRGTIIVVVWCGASVALLLGWRGWRPGPLDGAAWRPNLATGLAMTVTLLLAGVIGAAAGRNFGQLEIGAALAQLAAVAILFALRRRLMGRTECHPSTVGWSAIGGVVGLVIVWPMIVLSEVIGSTIGEALTDQSAPAIAHESLRVLERSGWSWTSIVIVFNAVITAPIVEEFLYRGVIQQTLREGGVRRDFAILGTAALFSIMHLGSSAVDAASAWPALPALFVLGALFGILYERTGRLAAPIAAHALFNGVSILLLQSLGSA